MWALCQLEQKKIKICTQLVKEKKDKHKCFNLLYAFCQILCCINLRLKTWVDSWKQIILSECILICKSIYFLYYSNFLYKFIMLWPQYFIAWIITIYHSLTALSTLFLCRLCMIIRGRRWIIHQMVSLYLRPAFIEEESYLIILFRAECNADGYSFDWWFSAC
jgi:hypothetical protein